MKKVLVLFILCILSPNIALYSVNVNENPQRCALLFLDESERNNTFSLGPVTNLFYVALSQEACPLIVSASVLINLFYMEGNYIPDRIKHKTVDALFDEYNETKKNIESLLENRSEILSQIKKKDITKDEETKLRTLLNKNKNLINDFRIEKKTKRQKLFLKVLNYDPEKWVLRPISHSLYLMVPVSYLTNLGITKKGIYRPTYDISPLTQAQLDTELKLGIKINHMAETLVSNISLALVPKKKDADYIVELLENKRIFCTHADYNKTDIKEPIWTLYATGHGEFEQEIISMNITSFKRMLDFYAQYLYVKLFVYNSCYAAGAQHEKIFTDMTTNVVRTYPFAMVTTAITEAPVSIPFMKPEEHILHGKGKFRLRYPLNFNKFAQHVTKSLSVNYQEVVADIIPSIDTSGQTSKIWDMIPQIKLPGLEWFSVLSSRKNIVSIGKILAQTRAANRPLDITKFFNTDPQALLLYAEYIPFELYINSSRLEAIISMKPGDATHFIKSVRSNQDVVTIIKWFLTIEEIMPLKAFIIKSINDEFSDAVIYLKKNTMLAFYKQEGVLYKVVKDYEKPIKASVKDGEAYEAIKGFIKKHVKDEKKYEAIKDFLEAKKKIRPTTSKATMLSNIIDTYEKFNTVLESLVKALD